MRPSVSASIWCSRPIAATCSRIPWQDQAIPIRFHDETASAAAILEAARAQSDRRRARRRRPADGHRRPRRRSARAARAHPPRRPPWRATSSARASGCAPPACRCRGSCRCRWPPTPERSTAVVTLPVRRQAAGALGQPGRDARERPAGALRRAAIGCARILQAPEIRSEQLEAHDTCSSRASSRPRVRGRRLLNHGALHVLAIFDKPDPLDGPFFEETIYVTPSQSLPRAAAGDRRGRGSGRARASACRTVRFTPSAASASRAR